MRKIRKMTGVVGIRKNRGDLREYRIGPAEIVVDSPVNSLSRKQTVK